VKCQGDLFCQVIVQNGNILKKKGKGPPRTVMPEEEYIKEQSNENILK
jgi:hypothetical protein